MTILTAKDVRRRHGLREVLRGAELGLAARERVGLIGRNGSGKSTLARILAGLDVPDSGEVVRRSGLRVGYLAQAPDLPAGHTAIEAVLAGMGAWQQAMARHAELSERLAIETTDALLRQQTDAAAEVERHGGWDRRHEAEKIMSHVGVTDLLALVETMSGGERRRVALAQVLAAEPELAILDEPTNHLDIDAIEWLERWLDERFTGALVLVTHDRALLDAVVSRTLEVEDGHVHAYDGGWGSYLEAKAERMAHAARVDANRRNFLRTELEWLRRSPQARTTKQKARIDRVVAVRDAPTAKAESHAQIAIESTRAGNVVIEAEDLALEVAGRRLVSGLTLRLVKGERIGILGPNGCGKTTLLRALTRTLEPTAGTVQIGRTVKIAYLDQMRTGLRDEDTVLAAVAEGRTRIELGDESLDIGSYLERFLFDAQTQRQLVGTLSGGERARVALARAMRDAANVIVLDEPTNDLDVSTLAALESALLATPATLLVVTHDRWFLDRIATAILAFEEGAVVRYEGNWSDYAARRVRPARPAAEPRPTPAPARSAAAPRTKLTHAETRELAGLLERVAAAETRVEELVAQSTEPAFHRRPHDERRAHFADIEAARREASELTDRWMELEARKG